VEDLRSIIDRVVRDAVREAIGDHQCMHGLSPHDVQAMRQVADYLVVLGGGDTTRGAEVLREQSRVLSKFMSISSRVGSYIVLSVVGAVLVVAGSSIVRGVVDFIRSQR
jgi:hypothetical protein